MKIQLPYHKTHLLYTLDDNRVLGVYSSQLPSVPSGEAELVRKALDAPIASPRLEELAAGKKTALVITSDHTRPVPSQIIMPQILERLRRGQPDIRITILVATGAHRATTWEELVAKLGEKIVAEEKIVVHDATDDSQLTEAGTLPSGGKLRINRLVMESDLVVAEGFIEPHFFAEFSGGRKSILPGVVARETVMANHCAEFINSPFARTGNLENNPIHRDMLYAAKVAKLAFIVNVVINGEKKIVHAVAGDSEMAHLAGCRWLKKYCGVQVPQADIVITSNGGYPLDQNLYQAVKGMTAGEAACREGGVIIIAASCTDGHGGNSFYRMLAQTPSAPQLLERISSVPRNATEPDQWQVQILVRILSKHTVIVVTTDYDHRQIEEMHLLAANSLEEAMRKAEAVVGASSKIAVIPDGVSVIVNP